MTDRKHCLAWFGEMNEPDFRNVPPVGKVKVLAGLFKGDSETNNFLCIRSSLQTIQLAKFILKVINAETVIFPFHLLFLNAL